jgi:hypothetical protein
MNPTVKAQFEELRRKAEAHWAQQPHFRSPKWAAALDAVWSLLPITPDHIKAPWNLTPESIAEAADAIPFAYEVVKVARWWEHETGTWDLSEDGTFRPDVYGSAASKH